MRGHSRLLVRPWLLAVGAVLLASGHVIFFNRLRHAGVSLGIVSGLVLLMIAKHLGMLGSLYALVRRRSRH
jgi:hypothetical protein